MKITRRKLNRKTQIKLLEIFIAEVVADLWGIQANTSALFYRKILQIIMCHLDQNTIEIFEEHIELDESYFGEARKGKRSLRDLAR